MKRRVLVSIVALVGSYAQAATWPAIVPVSKSFEVDFGRDLVSIDLPVTSADGRARYLFWCQGGSTDMLDAISNRDQIHYVGPLMCVLNEGRSRSEGSLLAEDDVAAWHTRGMFRAEELAGACGDYPEFGRERTFRLRGFVLRLAATGLQAGDDGKPRRFTLDVSVQADKTATLPQADRPGYLAPVGDDCREVRKGKETRMCRDWSHGGSYAPCPPR